MYCMGWVTVSGVQLPVRENLSQYNQSPMSTQPGHPSVSRRDEYQQKGGDAVRLGNKGSYGWLVSGWQVNCVILSLPCYHGPYLSDLAMRSSRYRAICKHPITLTL